MSLSGSTAKLQGVVQRSVQEDPRRHTRGRSRGLGAQLVEVAEEARSGFSGCSVHRASASRVRRAGASGRVHRASISRFCAAMAPSQVRRAHQRLSFMRDTRSN